MGEQAVSLAKSVEYTSAGRAMALYLSCFCALMCLKQQVHKTYLLTPYSYSFSDSKKTTVAYWL